MAAKSYFTFQETSVACTGTDLDLHKIAQPRQDTRFQPNHFTGAGCSQDLHCPDGGETKGPQNEFGVTLRDCASELRGRFNQQHAREERFAGKVAAQERFIATHRVLSGTVPARIQVGKTVEESELRSMREETKCICNVVGHASQWLIATSIAPFGNSEVVILPPGHWTHTWVGISARVITGVALSWLQ